MQQATFPFKRIAYYGISLAVVVALMGYLTLKPAAWGQASGEPAGPSARDPNLPDTPATTGGADEPATDDSESDSGLPILELLFKSGWFFMVPFGIATFAVIVIVVERFITLSSAKVMPQGLISGLGQLGNGKGGFDPRRAYRLCQQYPSAAAAVIRAMLLKVGRPHSEVEHAVQEASDREADRLYGTVRWLNLAAAVAPLWGLLGTVVGIMQAFHETSKLKPGQNMAAQLADGIYTALVTTMCGLLIAIPAAIFAHYFEGRITALFHRIDELLFNLLPQIERYEGRVRFNRQLDEADGDSEPNAPPIANESRPAVAAPK